MGVRARKHAQNVRRAGSSSSGEARKRATHTTLAMSLPDSCAHEKPWLSSADAGRKTAMKRILHSAVAAKMRPDMKHDWNGL